MCLDLNASVLATMPPVSRQRGTVDRRRMAQQPRAGDLLELGRVRQAAVLGLPIGRGVRARRPPAIRPAGRPASTSSRRGRSRSTSPTAAASTRSAKPRIPDGDLLHLRYQSCVDDAHGHGPLEAGGARMTAANILTRYATTMAVGDPAVGARAPRRTRRRPVRRPESAMGASPAVVDRRARRARRAASPGSRRSSRRRTWR